MERLERLESRHRSRVDLRREPHRVHGIEPCEPSDIESQKRARARKGHTQHTHEGGESYFPLSGFFHCRRVACACSAGADGSFSINHFRKKKRRHSGAGGSQREAPYTLL